MIDGRPARTEAAEFINTDATGKQPFETPAYQDEIGENLKYLSCEILIISSSKLTVVEKPHLLFLFNDFSRD